MEKIENGQKVINTIETEIPKNLAKDFDAEFDDIFTKLGTLSPSNSSFDSPIPLNRNKKFFDEFTTDIPHTLRRNTTNKILNFKSNFKPLNTIHRTKKILRNKNDDYFNKTENINNLKTTKIIQNNSKKYKKNNFETHKKLKSDNFVRMTNKSFNKTYYFNENISNNKKLPIINENIKNNKNKENMKIINEKIENILNLLKNIKEIDGKIKKKDLKKIINNLLINKNNENYIYETLIQILEFIFDILNWIKLHSSKSNYKVGNEKIILKLKNELKDKEKQIGEILNNSKQAQDKLKEIINTNDIDIANLKKENKEILNKLYNYQRQISKIESNKEILEEKINKIIIEKTTKSINSSTSIRSTFIDNISNKPKLENANNITINSDESSIDHFNKTQQIPQRYIPPSEQNKNINMTKLNEKYNLIKKLNMNLLDLLKEINNFLCLYDSVLNKEFGMNKTKNKNLFNNTKSLINNMDINILIDENKTKTFCNEFMRNVEIIYNKLDEYIKNINSRNNNKIINKLNNTNSNTINNDLANKTKSLKPDNISSLKKRTKTFGNLKPK